jgi:hypothetical protein
VVLSWADGAGQFFSQKPLAAPDDSRALRLFTWAGDTDAVEIWKTAGFNPVLLPAELSAQGDRSSLR